MPSSPFGRVMGFAQLGASLVYGTMSDSVSQYFAPKSTEQDPQKPANRCAMHPFSFAGEGLSLGRDRSLWELNAEHHAASGCIGSAHTHIFITE